MIDQFCQLNRSYSIFNDQSHTLVFNSLKDETGENVSCIKIDFNENIIPQILNVLYDLDIQSVVIEGGSQTLDSFINHGLWDEALVFTGNRIFNKGVPSPKLNKTATLTETYVDSILEVFYNNEYIKKI